MSAMLQTLGIDRMSIDERISLVTAIWDSISEVPHESLLTDAQREELQRRLAEHAANPDDVVPWETIKSEALARFQK